MSKWLRKNFGNNNNSNPDDNDHIGSDVPLSQQQTQYPPAQQQQQQQNPFPEPQQQENMAPGAATAAAPYNPTPPPPPPPQSMGGYPPPAGAMDVVVDHQSNYDGRSKGHYTHSQYQHQGGGTNGASPGNKVYDGTGERPSRSVRSRHTQGNREEGGDGHRHRSRSNRSSTSNRSGRSSSNRSRPLQQHGNGSAVPHYPYTATAPQQAGGGAGATNAAANPNSAPPQHHNPYQAPQAPPPQYGGGHHKTSTVVSASPPPDGAPQSNNYPPPAVSTQPPPQVQSQPSQRRPAYLLHRDLVIGKGSYGQVCIASRGEAEGHSSSGRSGSGKRKKFACKCVVLRNDPKYIAKLQEEVNVLRELRGHENVIRLYDVFCVDNELFIITELGRGGDLFHLLTTHPKHGVTEAYAAKTVAQMLSAVAFLHSRNICHRDLKLENWVLESGKDVWSPLKLIDFGLSTHFTPGHRLSRVVGSSYYVAPEVLKKSYTEACDLWSLGVIVYMLLSGAPPFYGKNDEAIKASIVQGEYTFPHELFRDVSDEAMAFVSTLLSYNTEYRYTAEQALTHPWLAANLDPEQLQRAKDGARGVGTVVNDVGRPEPMQL